MISIRIIRRHDVPDSKVHGANMGSIWGRQDPGGSHVGPMNPLSGAEHCAEWWRDISAFMTFQGTCYNKFYLKGKVNICIHTTCYRNVAPYICSCFVVKHCCSHNSDVTSSVVASSRSVVYSNFCLDVHQKKYQSFSWLASVSGIHQWLVVTDNLQTLCAIDSILY